MPVRQIVGDPVDNSADWQWTDADREAVAQDLGREPRGVLGVGARSAHGRPLVVVTAPRLPDGTPFPTTFYLTDADLVTACSRLEAEHFMDQLAQVLAEDEDVRALYERAHGDYLARRAHAGTVSGVGNVQEIEDFSAGGMPTRVKCLHALVGHSLVAGPGVNPMGDRALSEIVRRGFAHSSLDGSVWMPNLDQEDSQAEGEA